MRINFRKPYLKGIQTSDFVLVFFSPASIAITSLGEERANVSAFRMFVRLALDWFCLSSSWYLERVATYECGTPWTFLLPFFLINDFAFP